MTEQPHALPGLRMPDVVTGAAVTCAIGATICGGRNIVSLDSSIHVTESARVRLARLGLHPTLVTGEGEGGWPDSAPFDRILASYSVPRVPCGLPGATRCRRKGADPHHDRIPVVARARGHRQERRRCDHGGTVGGAVRAPGLPRPAAPLPLEGVPGPDRRP